MGYFRDKDFYDVKMNFKENFCQGLVIFKDIMAYLKRLMILIKNSHFKVNFFTQGRESSTNAVSMFELAIEEFFQNYFG